MAWSIDCAVWELNLGHNFSRWYLLTLWILDNIKWLTISDNIFLLYSLCLSLLEIFVLKIGCDWDIFSSIFLHRIVVNSEIWNFIVYYWSTTLILICWFKPTYVIKCHTTICSLLFVQWHNRISKLRSYAWRCRNTNLGTDVQILQFVLVGWYMHLPYFLTVLMHLE